MVTSSRRSKSAVLTDPQSAQVSPDDLVLRTNPLETFFDVLNRDQRTILTISRKDGDRAEKNEGKTCRDSESSCGRICKSSKYSVRDVESFKITEPSFCCRKNRSRSRESRRKFKFNGVMGGLGEVFIIGICLLTIVRVPAVMTAPSNGYHSHKTLDEIPKYMFPCGRNYDNYEPKAGDSVPRVSDLEILERIITQTRNALTYAKSFRDPYTLKTFGVPFEKHHAHFASHNYKWLPNESNVIPKSLGKKVDDLHLKSNSFKGFLVQIYEHLQKFAVALEQVVLDQNRMHGDFVENFTSTELHLRQVLCAIHEAMEEKDISHSDVPRSIMPDHFRNPDTDSVRNFRDWFIYRDLLNAFEYVLDVFKYFLNENLPSPLEVSS